MPCFYFITLITVTRFLLALVFVFILFHSDNDKFDVGQQYNVHDVTARTVNRRSINQPLVLKSLVV
jgi:hypothetical protein